MRWYLVTVLEYYRASCEDDADDNLGRLRHIQRSFNGFYGILRMHDVEKEMAKMTKKKRYVERTVRGFFRYCTRIDNASRLEPKRFQIFSTTCAPLYETFFDLHSFRMKVRKKWRGKKKKKKERSVKGRFRRKRRGHIRRKRKINWRRDIALVKWRFCEHLKKSLKHLWKEGGVAHMTNNFRRKQTKFVRQSYNNGDRLVMFRNRLRPLWYVRMFDNIFNSHARPTRRKFSAQCRMVIPTRFRRLMGLFLPNDYQRKRMRRKKRYKKYKKYARRKKRRLLNKRRFRRRSKRVGYYRVKHIGRQMMLVVANPLEIKKEFSKTQTESIKLMQFSFLINSSYLKNNFFMRLAYTYSAYSRVISRLKELSNSSRKPIVDHLNLLIKRAPIIDFDLGAISEKRKAYFFKVSKKLKNYNRQVIRAQTETKKKKIERRFRLLLNRKVSKNVKQSRVQAFYSPAYNYLTKAKDVHTVTLRSNARNFYLSLYEKKYENMTFRLSNGLLGIKKKAKKAHRLVKTSIFVFWRFFFYYLRYTRDAEMDYMRHYILGEDWESMEKDALKKRRVRRRFRRAVRSSTQKSHRKKRVDVTKKKYHRILSSLLVREFVERTRRIVIRSVFRYLHSNKKRYIVKFFIRRLVAMSFTMRKVFKEKSSRIKGRLKLAVKRWLRSNRRSKKARELKGYKKKSMRLEWTERLKFLRRYADPQTNHTAQQRGVIKYLKSSDKLRVRGNFLSNSNALLKQGAHAEFLKVLVTKSESTPSVRKGAVLQLMKKQYKLGRKGGRTKSRRVKSKERARARGHRR